VLLGTLPFEKFQPIVQIDYYGTGKTTRVYVFSYTDRESFYSNMRKELGIPADHVIYFCSEWLARSIYHTGFGSLAERCKTVDEANFFNYLVEVERGRCSGVQPEIDYPEQIGWYEEFGGMSHKYKARHAVIVQIETKPPSAVAQPHTPGQMHPAANSGHLTGPAAGAAAGPATAGPAAGHGCAAPPLQPRSGTGGSAQLQKGITVACKHEALQR
jgi:hypothetical protein